MKTGFLRIRSQTDYTSGYDIFLPFAEEESILSPYNGQSRHSLQHLTNTTNKLTGCRLWMVSQKFPIKLIMCSFCDNLSTLHSCKYKKKSILKFNNIDILILSEVGSK